MKISVNLGGIFENASWLMGLEPFSYALADQPDLVEAICQRVGDLTVAAAAHAVSIDNVGMVFLGDDLGFASGTLVSPAVLRKHVFPHHRRLEQVVHAAGRLLLLHSCGNLRRVMDDVIEIGFDGKHSFEDKIMPVEEVSRHWGDRIAIPGRRGSGPAGKGEPGRGPAAHARDSRWLARQPAPATAWARATRSPTTFRARTTWPCSTREGSGIASTSARRRPGASAPLKRKTP